MRIQTQCFVWRPSIRPAALQLDYLARRRRARWPGLLLLVLALGLATALVVRHREVQLELERLELAAGLVGVQQPPARMPQERLDEEVKNAEAVVRSLTLPWATLVQAVEQAATRDVALLQLQPDAGARLLRLTAEARHRDAMFEYARRLGAARGVVAVHFVSHQVQRDDPRRPVQFSLQATLR